MPRARTLFLTANRRYARVTPPPQTQLRVGVSHVFTMADNISLEQKVFTQSFDEIVTVLSSSNLTDIASKLVAKGLIPQGLYDNIVYPVPGITEKQRAGQVVSRIRDVVKSSPQKFGDFVEILRGDSYNEDLVKKLDSNYLQEELAHKTSEYLHRSIYSLFTSRTNNNYYWHY